MIGTGLGHYTITGHLGSGGMGEVYQATDARLGRDVAVKFLPDTFAHDQSRVARLQREARALAALNHPNIATIHGFEEIGGRHFLVMELVQGTTLAAKLARGRLPLDETIRYGTQIADALAAAHARGIVHRDLKPGNIMVTKSGVKVLDFGLAKSAAHDETLTQTDVVMGTPAYMSPEQREGGICDARSDIYSFGLILLEMATGRREVDAAASKELPAHLVRVIQACLERDPDARWQSAADIRRALSWASAPVHEKPRGSSRLMTWASVAAVVGIVAGGASAWFFRPEPATVARVVRFDISQSGPTALTISEQGSNLALTPDGSRLVYVGNNGTQLFVRAFDTLEPRPIASGTGIQAPAVSPNGQSVFYLDGAWVMRVVPITGGAAVTLPTVGRGGATWLDDETIVAGYSSRQGVGLRLIRVNEPTAKPAELTRVDIAGGEASHVWPQTLPGGRTILFTITAQTGGLDAAQIALFDTETKQKTIIWRGGSGARYMPDPRQASGGAGGYLIYLAGGALRARPFDVSRLAFRGPASPVPVTLVTDTFGSGEFTTDARGTLAYVDAPEYAAGASKSVVWIDWAGKETPVGPPGPYFQARLSPDETKVALVAYENGEQSIHILDVARQVPTRLRLDPVVVTGYPVWLPGGTRIAFQGSVTGGSVSMWTMAADGTGIPERVLTSDNPQMATSAPSDGYLVFHEATPQEDTGLDILRVKLGGSRQGTPLLRTKDREIAGVVSPDRSWIAYECCTESPDIVVSPYPNTDGGQWTVSRGGGRLATWSPEGDLFFVAPNGSLMRVVVQARGTAWRQDPPVRVLAKGPPATERSGGFDISRDGRRVLMLKPANPSASPPRIIVVQDWVAELARASR
jgi:serine/threonine-protein kinase